MASSGVPALLPPVKSVMVFKNGDPFFSGRRFIVSQRQVATMESFLNDVTLSIGAPLAVRTLYTPRHGHRVADLEHLQQGAQYVAAGFERFKKLDYLSLGTKRAPVARNGDLMQAKGLSRPNVSAKWRKVVTLPCIIHVFRNGDILSPAMRFIIPRSLLKNLEQILSLVSEKAMLRTGAVRRLCSLDGVTVTSAEELESGQCYVAVGAERYKKLPYVELLLNKAPAGSADRYYAADRSLHRRSENRKFPHDSNSDSALFHSPERVGRRVKSTGDEAEQEGANLSQLKRSEGGEGIRDERSIFYAKPVRVRKQRAPHRAAPRNTGQSSVFKGIEQRREEVRGAEEVAEDDSTAVELPVDQRDAEVVQEEDIEPSQTETTNYMHQTGAPDEQMTSSEHFSPSPSDREHGVKEYGPSDGETSLSRRSSSLNEKAAAEERDKDLLSDDLEQQIGQEEKDEGLEEAEETETQDHNCPPSSSSQQTE